VLGHLAGSGAMNDTLNRQGTGLNPDKIHQFVAQLVITAITVAVPSAAIGVLLLFVLTMLGFKRGLRILTVLGYGLASPAAMYANNFYSHQFIAALLFGAFVLILTQPREAHWRAALLFGLLCGFSLISEYPAGVIVAALGVYILLRWSPRAIAMAVLGGLLPLALMGLYDQQTFGTILPVGYTHSALWQNQHQTGFLSLTYPHPLAIWGLTFSSYRGLFVRAPWMLLALPGFVLMWRERTRRGIWWVILASTTSLLLVYASSIMWWGGFASGPRYIVPMLPFLAVPAAYGLHALWQRTIGRVVALALVSAALLLTWAEGLAHQGFPPDTFLHPWSEYTLPAWQQGDIARNLGMALGLHGALSLVPLLIVLTGMIGVLLVRPATRRSSQGHPLPGRAHSVAPDL